MMASCIGLLNAIDTFYMDEYCGETIDMILLDEFAGRLSIDGSFVGDCNVTIQTWFTNNRISFYFEDFDLGVWEAHCPNTFLTVYDGQDPTSSPLMHGLHKECGSRKPGGNYASNSRYVTIRYFNTDTTNDNHFDLIFTAFHKGYCYSYEYECSNGHCIDDSVNCNGFNPCGDGSDCRLSAAAIVGITLGSLFCVCVFSALIIVYVKNQRRKKNQTTGYRNIPPTVAPPPCDVTPATYIRATSPPPSYGIAQQYSTATTYYTPTSIQDDK